MRPLRIAVSALISLVCLAAGAGDAEIRVADPDDRPVADAVVALHPTTGEAPDPRAPLRAVIDQIDEEFVPYVSAVRAGTAVSFPNRDAIRHHVYSFSEAKKFELPLYKGVPAEPVVFDRAGTVVLGCNIHDWMLAYVYVVGTPWFAVTDSSGRVVFADLPTGEYRVEVQHPRLRDRVVNAAIDVDASVARLTVALRLQPDLRRG
ncbi:MAG TPA: hypothetical protein VD788_03585, partial [Candidatus Polarisedimenticolaceae bacterium]|nr:hypothetical protein [Candidatus Polarisedimenticolaceae bacterium]